MREGWQEVTARPWLRAGLAAGARSWVEAHGGAWNHDDWLALLDDLRRQGLGGVDVDGLARVLERCKVEYWNLRRWRDSGEAWRWEPFRPRRRTSRRWSFPLTCGIGPTR